jgi:hypothetical protein
MKIVRYDLNEAQMVQLVEGRIFRVVRQFFENNHRMPNAGELAFYCPQCFWWTDTQKHLCAVEVKLATKGNDCVLKIGDDEYTVKIYCPECEGFLRSCSVQKFLSSKVYKSGKTKKEGATVSLATSIPAELKKLAPGVN